MCKPCILLYHILICLIRNNNSFNILIKYITNLFQQNGTIDSRGKKTTTFNLWLSIYPWNISSIWEVRRYYMQSLRLSSKITDKWNSYLQKFIILHILKSVVCWNNVFWMFKLNQTSSQDHNWTYVILSTFWTWSKSEQPDSKKLQDCKTLTPEDMESCSVLLISYSMA
jgi:hypothetical protein